ncbi:MAG: BON domain-containing protein [Planctomycetota bacterium]
MSKTYETTTLLTLSPVLEHTAAQETQRSWWPEHQGLSSDEVDRIAVRVMGQLAGQLRRLRIVVRHDGIVLHGYVRSYYAKQLVQEAVRKITDVPIAENAVEVV